MTFPFLSMKLAIDKLNGCGLCNTVPREHLLRLAVLATEGLPASSKTEHFSYKDEWVNV